MGQLRAVCMKYLGRKQSYLVSIDNFSTWANVFFSWGSMAVPAHLGRKKIRCTNYRKGDLSLFQKCQTHNFQRSQLTYTWDALCYMEKAQPVIWLLPDKGFSIENATLESTAGNLYLHAATTCSDDSSPPCLCCSVPHVQCWARSRSKGSLLQKKNTQKVVVFIAPYEL